MRPAWNEDKQAVFHANCKIKWKFLWCSSQQPSVNLLNLTQRKLATINGHFLLLKLKHTHFAHFLRSDTCCHLCFYEEEIKSKLPMGSDESPRTSPPSKSYWEQSIFADCSVESPISSACFSVYQEWEELHIWNTIPDQQKYSYESFYITEQYSCHMSEQYHHADHKWSRKYINLCLLPGTVRVKQNLWYWTGFVLNCSWKYL